MPLVSLLGSVRPGIAVYGSGGFTSYERCATAASTGRMGRAGLRQGEDEGGQRTLRTIRGVCSCARKAIGEATELFVDANGAYTVTQALGSAIGFAETGVRWFEEPVSSDNLAGSLRDAGAGADRHGYCRRRVRLHRLVLRAHAGGGGGHRAAGRRNALRRHQRISRRRSLCWAANIPLSSHCGPSMHLHVCCAVPRAVHMEFFHDHARIERMFFEVLRAGRRHVARPSRPGMGLSLKEKDAAQYRV